MAKMANQLRSDDQINILGVSDSKNGAWLEWWVKSLYNDLYHWIRILY